MLFTKTKSIHDIKVHLSRDEIIRRSRILVIDDERPDVIDDLKKAGFSVDYESDITNDNMKIIDTPIYDLILLDFGNVGKSFGADEGLSLLRHIKRVNPAIIVFAYTSKALTSKQADFYILTDGVLSKDAGIAQSLEKIEDGLRKAHNIQNIWSAFIKLADIEEGSNEDKKWQDLYVRGLNSEKKMKLLNQEAMRVFGSDLTLKIGMALLTKLIELGIKALIGA